MHAMSSLRPSALGGASSSRRVHTTSLTPASLRAVHERQLVRPGSRQLIRRAAAEADTSSVLEEAEARWKEQIRAGKVKYVNAREIAQMMRDGWVLLDVRPQLETQRVGIKGAVEVPLFLNDTSMQLGSMIKNATNFGMGGWWLGGTHMIPNLEFMSQVQARVPKDARVIVGCQKGLRSLAACEQLSRAGYQDLGWINGGFDSCKKELPTTTGEDVRYAGIGGISEVLGWTPVQQEESKEKLGGATGMIKIFAVILLLDLLSMSYGWYQVYQATGSWPVISFGL